MPAADKTRLTIRTPDDWHLHVRDGDMLRAVIAHSAHRFARAIIMPNLKPPVVDVAAASAYRDRIIQAQDDLRAKGQMRYEVKPLMTLYLTDATTPEMVRAARSTGWIHGIKLYPAGATTNSTAGINRLESLYPVFEEMQKCGLVLQVHGEVTDSAVDVFDREAVFIENHLAPLVRHFPELKVVLEHITTKDGAYFVRDMSTNVCGTITPQHLLYNRNALFTGGLRPHHYCLPVLKRETHRHELVRLVTSGLNCYFAGTDSAPHTRSSKEQDCGCAGIYTANAALELYAEVFDAVNALDKLEAFVSEHGADFYGQPLNAGTITLEKSAQRIPPGYECTIDGRSEELVPLRAGESVAWRIVERTG